jgi:predicted permease
MASVSLLMLIVALNVAGLLLARAAARQQEMAVRLAIGGTPLRLARQMITESSRLAVLGAAGGLLMARLGTPLAVHLLPPMRDLDTSIVPLAIDTRLNGRVLLFILGLLILMTVIFTVRPLLTTVRLSIDSVLRTARSSRSLRGRQLLIVLQIGLCTFLLVGAGLLVRSFAQLRDTPSGFARDSIATFSCDLEGYKNRQQMLKALMTQIRQIPGVVAVAASSVGVMRGHGMFANIAAAGHRVGKAEFMATAANNVSPDYFATMRMHILAGRDFTPADIPKPGQTAPVRAVVNEMFVRRFFPGVNPLGRQFGTPMEGGMVKGTSEIIGVVSDAKYRSLKEPIRPMSFGLERNFDSFVLYVRTQMRPEQIIEPVRKATAAVAPGLPFLEVNTLAHEVEESTAPERITATLASMFGGLATLLAGIGMYGLLAYAVTQRRREIGIRMALGAQSSNVAGLIMRQTFAMAAIGIVAGLAAAMITGPAMRSLLYGVSANDPNSFIAAAFFVAVIAAAATALPVLEATRVQPAETLRAEN